MGFRLHGAIVAFLLAVPLAGGDQAEGTEDTTPQALIPLAVAMDALPGVVQLAISEAEEQLSSDQSQARIDLVHAYVQGFNALPEGREALASGETRAAYEWVQQVIETFLALPAQFAAIETGGAICRSYGQDATPQQVQTARASYASGSTLMAALRAEAARLAGEAPSALDRSPLDEALGLLDAWSLTEGKAIGDCIATLRLANEPPPDPDDPDNPGDPDDPDDPNDPDDPPAPAGAGGPALNAVAIPSRTFPTGQVRIVGSVAGLEAVVVTVRSAGLSLSETAAPVDGAFSVRFTVPREASLATHIVDVRAGGLHVPVALIVEKAEVSLHAQAPSRVVSNGKLAVQFSLDSPAGRGEVDRAPLTVAFGSETRTLALLDGQARAEFTVQGPGTLRLDASYPGTDILEPATATQEVQVFTPSPVRPVEESGLGVPVDWMWWLLAAILALLGAIALFLMPVLIHRLGGARSRSLRGQPSPPRWPGADSFVAGVGTLFDLLRRRKLVPPGRTVREWVAGTGGPPEMAERFEAVRYGGAPEDPQTRQAGLSWAERMWAAWRAR